jgi:hypothetical protein
VTTLLEASRLAEAALFGPWDGCVNSIEGRAITALRQAIEQAEQDHTYGYAKGLAEAIFKKHFASDEHYASGRIVWGVNDTVIGILTQIDNMVADMVRKPQQAEQAQPVAYLKTWHKDGVQHADIWQWEVGIDTLKDGNHYLYTTPPPRQPEQKTPGMAVQALVVEIIEALLKDEADGGYDLTAGLFGSEFSKLVRRWADAEWNAPPPRQPWVGLTDEQIMAIGRELGIKCRLGGNSNIDFDYARAIEAELKEKNT